MSLPYLGYAVVINNLSSDVEHWVLDVECIKSALDTVGFQVKAYNDCNVQVSIAIGKRLKLIDIFLRRLLFTSRNSNLRWTFYGPITKLRLGSDKKVWRETSNEQISIENLSLYSY